MHAGDQRGGGVAASQDLLRQHHVEDVGAVAANLFRQRQPQVAGFVQLAVIVQGEQRLRIGLIDAFGEAGGQAAGKLHDGLLALRRVAQSGHVQSQEHVHGRRP